MEITYFEDETLDFFDTPWERRNAFRLCSKLPKALRLGEEVMIYWNDVNCNMSLYFSMHPDEPYLRNYDSNGDAISVEVSPYRQSVIINFIDVRISTYYAGPSANYSDHYPKNLTPYRRNYDQIYCLYLYFLEMQPRKCSDHGKIDILRSLSVQKSNVSAIFDHGCRFVYAVSDLDKSGMLYVDCKDACEDKGNENDFDEDQAFGACKSNFLDIEYVLGQETEDYGDEDRESVISWGRSFETEILLVNKGRTARVNRVTQSPAMDWTDVLSQIGGFLGLLLGISVLTVVEFLEFVIIYFFPRFTKLGKRGARKHIDADSVTTEETNQDSSIPESPTLTTTASPESPESPPNGV